LARAGIKPTTKLTEGFPPTVTLISPSAEDNFNQKEVTLRYRIQSKLNTPLKALHILVDGRPLDSARGLKRTRNKSSGLHELTITLPERDLKLSVIAENRFGNSVPATASLNWTGKKQQTFVIKPKLYLLAIGVSDYKDDNLDLNFATKDANDFANTMKKHGKKLYREVVVKKLPNADSDSVLDGLDWLRDEVTSKDIAMLFMAGHGVNDADGDYYFLSSDANTNRLRRSAVSYFDIKKTLTSLPGKTIAFMDTCHSGNVMGGRRGVADINAVVNDLSSAENGVIVFTSSSGKQYSLENSKWGNGAFTKALVEGLSGKADYTKDGTITINQLDLYLSERVKKLTGNKQTPTTTKPQTISDFPILTQ